MIYRVRIEDTDYYVFVRLQDGLTGNDIHVHSSNCEGRGCKYTVFVRGLEVPTQQLEEVLRAPGMGELVQYSEGVRERFDGLRELQMFFKEAPESWTGTGREVYWDFKKASARFPFDLDQEILTWLGTAPKYGVSATFDSESLYLTAEWMDPGCVGWVD